MPAFRRLAAIFAADVAGYSRLMGEDEEGTLKYARKKKRSGLFPHSAFRCAMLWIAYGHLRLATRARLRRVRSQVFARS
jgi:hypothetical protein